MKPWRKIGPDVMVLPPSSPLTSSVICTISLCWRGAERDLSRQQVHPRHRFGVGVAVAAVALLIAFATTMAFKPAYCKRARPRHREAETSKRVSEFMSNMFKVSDPSQARQYRHGARNPNKASKDIRAGFPKTPPCRHR